MLSFQSNKKHDRQQYQKAICKILLDSRYKSLRPEFDVGMASYKKFSYLILKKISYKTYDKTWKCADQTDIEFCGLV
jgi:hypothetical protein